MGINNKRYNNQSIQHHHNFNQKIFLPIFCKLSLKDINLTTNQSKNRFKKTDEPSSPKVSCMGQVKRNNRVTTFPTTTTAAAAVHHQKYSRLRSLFSSKSLLPPAAPNPASVRSKSCRASKDLRVSADTRRLIRSEKNECGEVEVNIKEMDPPLPVVKKVARDEVNIWKRRGMQGLQIEQIPLPNCKFQAAAAPPTV